MIFCKPKYSVCKECQVHFEPAEDHEKRWGDLCPAHRKPVMERDRKIDCAVQYARDNWEKVYEIYQEEQRLYKSQACMQPSQEVIAQMAAAQRGAMQNPTPYGSIGGGLGSSPFGNYP